MTAKKKMQGLWVLFMGLMLVFSMLGIAPAYAADDEITIGIIGPMRFMHGKHQTTAANIAIEEINAKGGVTVKGKKYKLALKIVDDNEFMSIPDAISTMERLVTRDKVKFVIGGISSEGIMALQEVAADNKVIHMSVGGGGMEITQKVGKNYDRYKTFFRIMSYGAFEMGLMYMEHMVPIINALQKAGIAHPKVALITDQSAWTVQHVDLAYKILPQLGCEIVGSWKTKHTASTYIAELSAAKSAGAHIIYHAMSGPPGNIIVRQWGELKIPAILTGANAEAMKDVKRLWEATGGQCNWMSVAGSIDGPKTPLSLPFKAKFVKALGEEPASYGFGTYDGIQVLVDAIKRGQTLDPVALVPFIEKSRVTGCYGVYTFYPPGHERPHDVIPGKGLSMQTATQIIDGKRYIYWPDGKALPPLFEKMWKGAGQWGMDVLPGTVAFRIPPSFAEYWKLKK